MLQKLAIRNYAIIDHLILEPDSRLNIVTGETGAGKSIILGALSLILGERADSSVLISKTDKCVVEGHFDVQHNTSFKAMLSAEDLDTDDTCIIRREIAASGKSRAFVNDTPVTLAVLNKLTSRLVDLHQQFDHLALEDDSFQMDVVDAIGGILEDRRRYQDVFRRYRAITQELETLKARQAAWQKESDYKQFLYDELTQAAFQSDEIEQAEERLKTLTHAGRILSVLQHCSTALEEGEQPVNPEIKRLVQQLQAISDLLPGSAPLQERLASVHAELRDIASDLQSLQDKIDLNPALADELQTRIDLGYRLCKKHDVNSTSALLAVQEQLEKELQATADIQGSIQSLAMEQEALLQELQTSGSALSSRRHAVTGTLMKRMDELLALVGMPNARFQISLSARAQPGLLGLDDVSFLADTNKSGRYLPVFKSASGGEMSRIMLCIKSLTAKALSLPTLIFDEVDTGISGEAARQVGILLKQLSDHHQVICITHQPQVAARAARHFFVYKDGDGTDRLITRVRVLKPDERVLTIARMIGGEKPSEAALQNARELVLA